MLTARPTMIATKDPTMKGKLYSCFVCPSRGKRHRELHYHGFWLSHGEGIGNKGRPHPPVETPVGFVTVVEPPAGSACSVLTQLLPLAKSPGHARDSPHDALGHLAPFESWCSGSRSASRWAGWRSDRPGGNGPEAGNGPGAD